MLTVFLVTGLVLPRISMYLAWIGVFSRAAYVIGYIKKGPDARLFGAFFNLIPNYFTFLVAAFVLVREAFKNSGYIGIPSVLN